MKISQVAVQLYTVRQHAQNAKDLALTLSKIRAIGYRSVQVSGVGPIPAEEIAAMLKHEGLTCCATHESGGTILREPEKVAERLKILDCRHTAFPMPAGVKQPSPYPGEGKLESIEDVLTLSRELDKSGAYLKSQGIQLSYHNHAIEFRHFDGRTMLDIIYEKTKPENLTAEIDVYWVQAGGGDPAAWCRKLKGRLPCIHLKDYAIDADFKPCFAEIGYGNLDMKGIVKAADESGCQWFIVEQDICPGDPFISLEKSFKYIQANLCQA